MRRALRGLNESHPGLLDGFCWSVWELSTHPEKIQQMLKDADASESGAVPMYAGPATAVTMGSFISTAVPSP